MITVIKKNSPYITASENTWKSYAIYFAGWMDTANIAYLEQKKWILHLEKIGDSIPDFRIARGGRGYQALTGTHYRSTSNIMPRIQYGIIFSIAEIIVQSFLNEENIDISDFKESTKYKVLKTLEDFEFIEVNENSIKILDKLINTDGDPIAFSNLFKISALKMNSFKTFIDIISRNKSAKLKKSEIGRQLQAKLGVTWKSSTADSYIKIFFNWARNTGLYPDIYKKRKDLISNEKYMNILDFLEENED